MADIIRILLLEDVDTDAELIKRRLQKADPLVEVKWVQTRKEYEAALADFDAHLVISDHSLPDFNSINAFKMLRESGRDIPFVLVTATMSEEFAVMMMKEGIADYLLKDRLERLPLAVSNALDNWHTKREKQKSLDLLIQNETRFRALIENSHDMVIITDENFEPTFVSSSYVRITGRTLQDLREHNGINNIHPDDRIELYGILAYLKQTPGRYFDVLYRWLHKNGHYIWIEGTGVNMLADDGLKGILFNLRDVTGRKAAEESLQKSKANLNAIIENSNVSIYSIDRQFRYISFNTFLKQSLKQTYGLDIKVGDRVFEFLERFDHGELPGWEKVYTEAFSGRRVEFEKEFTVGEHYACLCFSINPIVEGHFVTGLSCFAWDITAQKLAVRKMSQSEARFRALIENTYDAIVLRDENESILYASPSVSRMLGYGSDDVYNAGYEELVHPDDLAVLKNTYSRTKEQPGTPFSVSVRLKKKNGLYIWTEGSITNMLGNESVKGIVSNFRDITERKENELAQEKIALDLIERNRNLEQYAYIVSHNLRGPVANILGIAHLLDMPDKSAEDTEASLFHLFESTRRLDQVVTDLNMILQLRQGINEQVEHVQLEALVRDIEKGIQNLVRKSRVDIVTEFAEVTSITTVRSYLYSIFYNLITNSIKYRKEGVRPVIRIVGEIHGSRTRIRFIDNGLGIDLTQHKDKVFGLYRRFHPDCAEGKGVGLFMTKTQVEALGGKISVRSEVGAGAEFIVEL